MVYFLRDDKVYLRKLSPEDDFENYLSFVNDVENLKWTDGVGNFPMHRGDLVDYVRNNKNVLLGIFNESGIHVGNIHLFRINFQQRHAMLGILIGRQYQKKGYATRACKLVLRYAFEVLNLHRIYLTVMSGNKAAITFYEKIGFVKEGVEKEAFRYDFKYYDFIRYRMLEEEYRRLCGHSNKKNIRRN